MQVFRAIGAGVQAAWSGCPEELPEVAVSSLAGMDDVRLEEVVEWALTTPSMPPQADLAAVFGDPPLTVFRGEGFRIDVNLWTSSTTVVHEHGFSGAFRVLAGSSLHVTHAFSLRETIGDLGVGTLCQTGQERLLPGATRPIVRGEALIHALLHLDHPSATVVVRTDGDGSGDQCVYEAPGVRRPAFPRWSPEEQRRMQLATFLLRTGQQERIEGVLREARPLLAYVLLVDVLPGAWLAQGSEGLALLEQLETWIGCAGLDGVLEAAIRRRIVHDQHVESWRRLTARRDREILGTLRCAASREDVEDGLRALFEGEPLEHVLAFLRRMRAQPDPNRPDHSVLGLGLGALEMLEWMVEGDDLEAILRRMEARHGAAAIEAARPMLASAFAGLRTASVLAPWFDRRGV